MFMDLSVERNRIEVLQKMLRYLSFALQEPELLVSINGHYDYVTETAVRRFQERFGLPVTGITDPATWEKIVWEYNTEVSRRMPVMLSLLPMNPDYTTGIAERSDTVLILQILLRALALRYDYPVMPPLSGAYGVQTAEAVRYFQEINGLTPTGEADRKTWHRISEEYNMLAEQ